MQQISGFNYFTRAMLVMEGIPTITVGESIPTRLVVEGVSTRLVGTAYNI